MNIYISDALVRFQDLGWRLRLSTKLLTIFEFLYQEIKVSLLNGDKRLKIQLTKKNKTSL